MKITKQQLKRIIKEEMAKLNELGLAPETASEDALMDAMVSIIDEYKMNKSRGMPGIAGKYLDRIQDELTGGGETEFEDPADQRFPPGVLPPVDGYQLK
jgi:hypothetical protein